MKKFLLKVLEVFKMLLGVIFAVIWCMVYVFKVIFDSLDNYCHIIVEYLFNSIYNTKDI